MTNKERQSLYDKLFRWQYGKGSVWSGMGKSEIMLPGGNVNVNAGGGWEREARGRSDY